MDRTSTPATRSTAVCVIDLASKEGDRHHRRRRLPVRPGRVTGRVQHLHREQLGGMSVIDAELKVVTDNINVGATHGYRGVAGWIPDLHGEPLAGLLSVIDATTVKVTDNLTLGGYTYGVAVSPTGSSVCHQQRKQQPVDHRRLRRSDQHGGPPVLSGTASVGNT